MGRTIRRLALVALTLPSAGCTVEHDLDLSKLSNLNYVRVSEAGHTETLRLSPRDEEYISLIEWFEQNRTGWRPLEATLLPGGLSIYGDGFNLRVVHRTAVLRYLDEAGEQRQLHKKIPVSEFPFLAGD